uniref:Uncharacterized protein n=1 Tax=Rhizophora mucronata TaxID=61149 RepID=A0A2P2PUB5_RHIMU
MLVCLQLGRQRREEKLMIQKEALQRKRTRGSFSSE